MRLLGTTANIEQGGHFSNFLNAQGIPSKFEVTQESDWGKEEYGTHVGRIWVVEEDDLVQATELFKEFLDNPEDAKYYQMKTVSPKPKEIKSSSTDDYEAVSSKLFQSKTKLKDKSIKRYGSLTLYILMACVWIFMWSKFSAPNPEPYPKYLPGMALFSSPVTKEMLYDYPEAYTLANKLVKLYGIERLKAPSELPLEGQSLIKKYLNTPYWNGFYDKIIEYLKNGQEIVIHAPLFEKIREGEVWRTFSPCLLHSDIFHLFFNMAWLLILGRQIESRIGIPKYLLFILITGIFSNTAQYLMSGPNFIGFSGVLCAMIVFVWFRQTHCPWEGYQLPRSTMGLITIFILLMFGIQLTSFILDLFFNIEFSPGIANTAHLTGAFSGYLLSKGNFFQWKP